LGIEFGDELVKIPELGRDCGGERAGGRLSTTVLRGRQIRPENAVVQMSSSIEANGRLQIDHLGHAPGLLGLGVLLQSGVEILDIGCVMFRVVELHDLSADDRGQRVIFIWKLRERIGLGSGRERSKRKKRDSRKEEGECCSSHFD